MFVKPIRRFTRRLPSDGCAGAHQITQARVATRHVESLMSGVELASEKLNQLTTPTKNMSIYSPIEWTDGTWNPVRGCTKISPGCVHCYAETFAERFRGVKGHPFEHGFDPRLVPDKLHEPLKWARPRRIFVNSMSDLFHYRVPDSYIHKVAEVMLAADWHIYQVLTKRPERMLDLLCGRLAQPAQAKHIWWGVSVENRKHGLPRLALLRDCPAAVKFLSVEPLLEDLGVLDLRGIHWVIVGGESGPGARAMEQGWVERILKQCRVQNVPFFFKQWGGVQKSHAGRVLNGRTFDEMPPTFFGEAPSSSRRRSMVAEFCRRHS